MLECKHKMEFGATNKQMVIEICLLHNRKLVNDAICSKCPDRCTEGVEPKDIETHYMKRSDEEIAILYNVCTECPLFKVADQTCSGMTAQPYPVDQYAQNPAHHCPERQW